MQHRHGLRHGLELESLCCSAQTSLPRTEVWIARGDSQQEIARFTVEIANTPETWERGLMERASLAPNAGMLFIFSDAVHLDDEHTHPTRYALYRCGAPHHQHPGKCSAVRPAPALPDI